MTTLEKIKKIEEVIEREIKPGLKKDGGDIELVDVDGDFVTVSLRGACASYLVAHHPQGIRGEKIARTGGGHPDRRGGTADGCADRVIYMDNNATDRPEVLGR